MWLIVSGSFNQICFRHFIGYIKLLFYYIIDSQLSLYIFLYKTVGP